MTMHISTKRRGQTCRSSTAADGTRSLSELLRSAKPTAQNAHFEQQEMQYEATWLATMTMPLPSQAISRKRSARFERKTKISPQ